MLTIAMICIFARGGGTGAIVLSMLLTYVMQIQVNMIWSLKAFMQWQSAMVSADRCLKLLEVPQEKLFDDEYKNILEGRDQWPEQGQIEFKNVSLKYRPDTETVLHKLSFKVRPGEKVGVVGRTGAGKSTICLSLSRIVEIFEGQIEIDGKNIQ